MALQLCYFSENPCKLGRMKTVLCYGDSNTWGYIPGGIGRFDQSTRWPAVLADCLGPGYTVIEEGLNGRTIGNYAERGNPLNGLEYFGKVLRRHGTADFIIIYLGINDIFQRPGLPITETAEKLGEAVKMVYRGGGPETDRRVPRKIFILSPLTVNIDEDEARGYEHLIKKSEAAFKAYKKTGLELNRRFGDNITVIDTDSIISASTVDGIHIDGDNHIALGRELCARTRESG